MDNNLTYGSMFAGIGGLDLGLEQAGMRCIWQAEIDKNCLSVLDRHFPNTKKIKDVRNVTANTADEVRVICGGFPCQDVSVSGLRQGLAGSRSGLWFEFARVIEELKPEWVVIENVPGLLSSNSGRDMGTVVGGLEKRGYWWAYRVLDSQFFGVPQRRRRVFIVASTRKGCPQEVLFEPESGPWDTPPGKKTRKETAIDIGATLKDGGRPDNETWLTAYWDGGDIADAITVSGLVKRQTVPEKRRFHYVIDITNVDEVVRPFAVGDQAWSARNGELTGQITHTLLSKNDGGYSENNIPHVGIRRLTPTECERLQGFPDGWTAGQSDSVRYKQLGNAVTVSVARWIGKRIVEVSGAKK